MVTPEQACKFICISCHALFFQGSIYNLIYSGVPENSSEYMPESSKRPGSNDSFMFVQVINVISSLKGLILLNACHVTHGNFTFTMFLLWQLNF